MASQSDKSGKFSSLGNMLGTLSPTSKKKKMAGSATVSGPITTGTGTPTSDSRGQGEIYIRPDGKKVRRVLKSNSMRLGGGDTSGNSGTAGSVSGATVTDDATTTGGSSSGGGGGLGEVYIRADGKKVRRVLRKASSSVAAAADPNVDRDTMSGEASVGSSRSASTAGLGGFLQNAATGAANASTPPRVGGGAATVTGAELGEIVVRADGKKVRRIKRTSSFAPSMAPLPVGTSSITDPVEPTTAPPSPSKLKGFLSSSNSALPPRGGAATVSGSGVEGEIYVNAAGKRVRRVKRMVSSASVLTPSATETTPKSLASSPTPLGGFLNTTAASNAPPGSPRRGAVSVGGADIGRGTTGITGVGSSNASVDGGGASLVTSEVYINAQGKKVRRVKKNVAAGSSATVSGDELTASASKAKSIAEGEIYIRPDGKKVRRVKRSNSSLSAAAGAGVGLTISSMLPGDTAVATSVSTAGPAPQSPTRTDASKSLGGFLVRTSPKKTAGGMITGSATVAGDRISSKIDGGEIYINAEGKKVRRVRKQRATQLGLTESILQERAMKSPARNTIPRSPGRSPGKQRKSTLMLDSLPKLPMDDMIADVTSDDRIADPPSVDLTDPAIAPLSAVEIKQTVVSAEPPAASSSLDHAKDEATSNTEHGAAARVGLQNLLQNCNGTSNPGAASSATVSGDTPARSSTGKTQLEGEIYIRADGKKVRRVRRSASNAVPSTATGTSNSLGGFLSNEDNKPRKPSGAATVVGDRKLDGEIIIRPDGKRVIRRAKSKQVGESPTVDGEVYRNAEGKLVRRVKRSASNTSNVLAPSAAATTQAKENSPEAPKSASNGSNIKAMNDKVNASSNGDAPGPIDPPIRVSRRASISRTVDPTKPFILLTEEEEGIATGYRKMIKMGLPEDAVRHKMTVSDVSRKIICAVMGEEWKEEVPPPAPVVVETSEEVLSNLLAMTSALKGTTESAPSEPTSPTAVQLNADEDAIAAVYYKMKLMGLPDDAVRHKMVSCAVHPKVVAAVMGDEWNGAAPEMPPSATDQNEITAGLHESKPAPAQDNVPCSPPVEQKGPGTAAINSHDVGEASTVNSVATRMSTSAPILTAQEEEMAAPFRKMQRMGLPDDAVRHKMLSSDIPPKVMAAVLGEVWISDSSISESDQVEPVVAISPMSADNEATVAQYRKMLKMGLPTDAVRHKMVLAEVDPEIIAAVFSNSVDDILPAAKPAMSGELSVEEETVAAQYRKMRQMGLPDDAVRHKMIVNEVDPKIISAVLNSPVIEGQPIQSQAEAPAPQEVVVDPTKSYVVIVGDAPVVSSPEGLDEPENVSSISLNPDEKFAVKVADEVNSDSSAQHTKFFTLEELAKLSGQSKADFEAIVSDKRKRGASPPRFTLQPLVETKYEVSIPLHAGEGARGATSAPTSPAVQAGVEAKNMAVVKEGEEVVDSQLAKAARAVSALGDGDMSALFEKLKAGDMKDLLEKLHEAEKRQKKLEKQLAQAGVAIAEDIEYSEAKGKVEQIAKRMNEIGGSDVTVADKEEQNRLREEYFKLEQEMERYNTALMLSEEYQAEQDRVEQKWEADNEPLNMEALRKIRRHMPVNVRHLSEADLTTKPSPNGKYLPVAIAKKFKRTNILQCIRLNPDDLESMHPATLENMRVTGLTLTERRAMYIHFKPVGPKWEKNKAEKMTERKWTWYQMMKNNFKENVAPYQRHIDQYGGPLNHTCPLLGKQCPIRADKMPDYDGDYGWTVNAEYEVSDVRKADVEDSGAKAMAEALELAKEKKANERADLLKKHYKGKLLQVSKANGGCEAMDESMDQMESNTSKWIEFMLDKGENESEDDKKKEVANFIEALNEFKLKLLNFAQRSGMQMSGKKTAGGDSPDIRSVVEASLAEEVYETSREWFTWIRDRMKKLVILDTRAFKTIDMLDELLNDLHSRNLAVFEGLGVKRMNRSHKFKTNADLLKQVQDRRKAREEPEPEEEVSHGGPPAAAAGGRGGLMDAISGRGRGGGGRGGLMDAISGRGGGGGRGGLLDAISSGRGRGAGGGRGGLMDAIAGRGAGRGDAGGGRGGLMDAIAGRGRGGGDGGRGGLMAAIAGRGAGRGGGDGRGGLLAAIASRGGGD